MFHDRRPSANRGSRAADGAPLAATGAVGEDGAVSDDTRRLPPFSGPHPAAPASREHVVLGIMGGSGFYEMVTDGTLQDVATRELTTPFGAPSGPFTVGTMAREDGTRLPVVFLPRHGQGHVYLPSEINYRANIHGFKQLGVTHMLSVSAVGSLREHIAPGDFVLVDQLIDRTKGRAATFFGQGVVAHVAFADPIDATLTSHVRAAADGMDLTVHHGGTCVVMEGPAFSTRAESELYRTFGADVIGMTALPEAKLAREAEIAYALVAMATDYDCWRVDEAPVTVEAVLEVMARNVSRARTLVERVAARLPARTAELPYPRACEHAVVTAPRHISPQARERLDLIIGHYL